MTQSLGYSVLFQPVRTDGCVEGDVMLCRRIGGVCADRRIGTYSGCREVHEGSRYTRIKKSHVMRVEDSGHI